MSEIKKKKDHSDVWEKWTVFAVMAGAMVFFCGHLSTVIKKGADLDNWSMMLREHLRTAPFDFFYVNYYVLYFAVCIFALIAFIVLSKRELPKAEMKGIEHGSNDFQTIEERNDFLEGNTTPIYSLDLHEFAAGMIKTEKAGTETLNLRIFKWISERKNRSERMENR